MDNLVAGKNIEIVNDEVGKQIIISAPVLNKTTLKSGPFTITGEAVNIVEGKNISISSAHPDTITISANIDKEIARIVDLENRIANIEKVIAGVLKPKAEK